MSSAPPTPPVGAAPHSTPKRLFLDPTFKLVFIGVAVISFTLLFVHLGLLLFADQSSAGVQNTTQILSALFTAGFGAIFGLIGGKLL